MADSIGPNPYQGGIAGGGAPQVNRYNQQVDVNGAPQPADARGQKVISGFGEAAPELARGLDDLGVAAKMWLAQQKSAADLAVQTVTNHVAGNPSPDQTASQQIGAALRKYATEQLATTKDSTQKQALTTVLSMAGGKAQMQAQALDQQQNADAAMKNFQQTLENKAQLYTGMPPGMVDGQLKDDLGEIGDLLNKTVGDPDMRNEMRYQVRDRLTNAANAAKYNANGLGYLQEISAGLSPAQKQAVPGLAPGLRNNNPGNLAGGSTPYGSESSGGPDALAAFDTPEAGLQAMGFALVGQQRESGPGTVADILSRNLHAGEKLSPAYAASVAQALNVKPDETVDLTRPFVLATVMHAMMQHQYGFQPYHEDSVMWGATRAAEPDIAGPRPQSGAEEGDLGVRHIQNGSLSFSMGTAAQQQNWVTQAILAHQAQQAGQAQALRQQAAQTLQQQRQATNFLLDRFAQDNLQPADITSSGLPDAPKQQLAALLQRGPDTPGNPALHRQLVMQAVSGGVTDKSDLLPYLARQDGINPQQADNIAFARELAAEPNGKRLLGDAETAIMGNQGGFADPQGDLQFSRMLFRLQDYADAAKRKGLSLDSILDPTSKYYVGTSLMQGYARNSLERQQAFVDQLLVHQAPGGLPPAKPGEDPALLLQRWKDAGR